MSQNAIDRPHAPATSANTEARRNKLLLALGGAVASAAVVSAAYWYLYGAHFVSTDNAYAAVEIAIAPMLIQYGGDRSAGENSKNV